MVFRHSLKALMVTAFALSAGLLGAMLPGEIYIGRIAGSEIQAIAVVKAIEEIKPPQDQDAAQKPVRPALTLAPRYKSDTYSSRQAVFIIEKPIKLALPPDADLNRFPQAQPEKVVLLSPDGAVSEKKPLPLSEGSEVTGIFHVPIVQTTDDPLFFSPEVGERVFVTISSNGGEITSYTILDNALENALLSGPDAVKIGIGKVFPR